MIIEFRVNDVDDDYQRLSFFLKDLIVQKTTTMPWGNRSVLFRDPDGNLVNLFAPVTPEVIKKLMRKLFKRYIISLGNLSAFPAMHLCTETLSIFPSSKDN